MVVIPAVIYLSLYSKVRKGIEEMRCVKTLIVLPTALLCLPIVTRCKGSDDLMPYPMYFQVLLKEGRLVPIGSKAIGEFRTIIRLDTCSREREGFYEAFRKLCGRIGAMFRKCFRETPSRILINGRYWKNCFPITLLFLRHAEGKNFTSAWIRCPGNSICS